MCIIMCIIWLLYRETQDMLVKLKRLLAPPKYKPKVCNIVGGGGGGSFLGFMGIYTLSLVYFFLLSLFFSYLQNIAKEVSLYYRLLKGLSGLLLQSLTCLMVIVLYSCMYSFIHCSFIFVQQMTQNAGSSNCGRHLIFLGWNSSLALTLRSRRKDWLGYRKRKSEN